jgi:uncharacterized protein (TIGR00297 family)
MLTAGGLLAALGVGILTFCGALLGWSSQDVGPAFTILFAFFFSSVGFSFVGRARKRLLVDIPKGGPRNQFQVAANGGISTLCAVIAAIVTRGGQPSHLALALLWAYVGAYSAATADTWATEIGSAFGGRPRSIVGFMPLNPGISGGITPVGTIAMCAGAAWIAWVWSILSHDAAAFWVIAVAGIAGALVDSLLGATLQAIAFCPSCKRPAETAVHVCGSSTVPWRGLRWMTNDAVNALATLAGGVAAAGLYLRAV